jgi:transposase
MLLSSVSGTKADDIPTQFGYSHETVRQFIRAFNCEGLTVLQTKLHRPHQFRSSVYATGLAMLKGLLYCSPRDFGNWTLELVTEVNHAQGIVSQRVSRKTNRQTVKHLDV